MEVINSNISSVIPEESTLVYQSSIYEAASSSSSSQIIPSKETDAGNDQICSTSESVMDTDTELNGGTTHHVISNADESPNQVEAVPPPLIVPLALIPSLRGKLLQNGASNICRGVWAMSDAAHDIPEQTSDFEFKLMKASAESINFPFSGKYQGWFSLKQPPPVKGTLKIDDRDMFIKFTPIGDGSYKVEGNGTNKFGKFSLRGILGTDHMMQIYREYQYKPLPAPRKRSAGVALGGTDIGNAIGKPSKKKAVVELVAPNSSDIKIENNSIIAAREGAGRARKPSAIIKDPDVHTVTKQQFKATVVAPVKTLLPAKENIAVQQIKTENGRAQRPPPQMQKCSDLLKELMKMPQAIWFLEPVDPIKMNVPDYPTLIKQPMDFGTVRTTLDRGLYDGPEAFADNVRLTFRNAITYNQLRDNPVHIAAREMAGRFEEKYRMMLTHLSSGAYAAADEVHENKVGRPVGSGGARKSSGGGAKVKGGSSSTGGRQRSIGGAGPRPVEAFFPPVADGSAQTMLAMQRQMEAMQSELKTLRTKVMQSEVKNDLEFQRDAAQNPLTFQEKKDLISKIHQLPSSKMQAVVDIIQDAIPPEKRGEGDEIEIPLDELDTFTLRKLQTFVEENALASKKKAIMASKDGVVGTRKPRKEKGDGKALGRPPGVTKKGPNYPTPQASAGVPLGLQRDENPADHYHADPLGDSIEEDDLFFSNESFDDLKAQAAENGADASDASDNEDVDGRHSSAFGNSSSSGRHSAGQVSMSNRERSDSLLSDGFDDVLAMKSVPPEEEVPSERWGIPTDEGSQSATSSAWDKEMTSSEVSLGEIGGEKVDGGADLWSAAAGELQAKQQREQDRKAEEVRLSEQRARQDEERIVTIRQQAQLKLEEKQQHEEGLERQKEEDIRLVQQRREDERKARQDATMNVDHDISHDDFDADL